jgi:hypothetical protein
MSWSKTRRSKRREGAARAVSLRGRGRLARAGRIDPEDGAAVRALLRFFVLNRVRLTY